MGIKRTVLIRKIDLWTGKPFPKNKIRHKMPKAKLLVYMRRKTVFEPYPNPKNSPLWPQKVKIDPNIKSKSKVRFRGTIENKSCSTA